MLTRKQYELLMFIDKRLRRRGASIALEPANKNYETRIFPADRVKVQGRLVALMRSY